MQLVLFASKELDEPEVRFGARCNDVCWGALEEVLAESRPIGEHPEAPITRTSDGNLPQSSPGNAVTEIGAQGLVVKSRGPDCLVRGPPRDVGQATTSHVAGTEVLEVAVDT